MTIMNCIHDNKTYTAYAMTNGYNHHIPKTNTNPETNFHGNKWHCQLMSMATNTGLVIGHVRHLLNKLIVSQTARKPHYTCYSLPRKLLCLFDASE